MKIVVEMGGVQEKDKESIRYLFENLASNLYEFVDTIGTTYLSVHFFEEDEDVEDFKSRIEDLETENHELQDEIEDLWEQLEEFQNDY